LANRTKHLGYLPANANIHRYGKYTVCGSCPTQKKHMDFHRHSSLLAGDHLD
jgi:hypothetical protein